MNKAEKKYGNIPLILTVCLIHVCEKKRFVATCRWSRSWPRSGQLTGSGFKGNLSNTMNSPVQFIVDEHPQIFLLFNDLHVMPQDGNWSCRCPGSPQIHHQLFGFCCVELQVVNLAPGNKVIHHHHSPVFSLLTHADTSNYSSLIRKLLKMARLSGS